MVSITDSVILNQYLTGLRHVADARLMDVDGNGIVSGVDSTCVISKVVGKNQVNKVAGSPYTFRDFYITNLYNMPSSASVSHEYYRHVYSGRGKEGTYTLNMQETPLSNDVASPNLVIDDDDRYAESDADLNELTDANFIVSGIARNADGSIDYLVFTSVNMGMQGGERHIGSTEHLCENEISGNYHAEDIRIGDLFKFDDYISTAGIPSQIGIEGKVEYKAYGLDVFGKEFQKVIRHEWISEPACFWHASDGGFDAGFDIVMGNATEDEKVDILDVISINKTILGKQSLNHYSKLATDINKNGNLDSSDSLAIMKYIVGIIDVLSE